MKLDNNYKMGSKQVKMLWGYGTEESITLIVERGSLPPPDIVIPNRERNRYRWTVGYVKNFMKLPTEIDQQYVKKRK